MKRGGYLKRGAPIQRSPMKRARKVRKHGGDAAYLRFVRSLGCCAPGCTALRASEAHHRTGAGLALKAHDRETMPLCGPMGCHQDFHDGRGAFRGWTREERAAWQDAQIRTTQVMYEQGRERAAMERA